MQDTFPCLKLWEKVLSGLFQGYGHLYRKNSLVSYKRLTMNRIGAMSLLLVVNAVE